MKRNIYLGELEVPVPPRRAGEVRIEVRFTYDNNGLLEAEAHVPLTGERFSLVIENNLGVLSPEEIAQRMEALCALKVHPRDQQVNSVLMTRLERLYQESLGDLLERAGSLAQDFQRALDSQDERVIRDARKSLAERLDRLERHL